MIARIEKRNLLIYGIYLGALLALFFYANITGWRLYNTDKVEHVDRAGGRTHHSSRFYHK